MLQNPAVKSDRMMSRTARDLEYFLGWQLHMAGSSSDEGGFTRGRVLFAKPRPRALCTPSSIAVSDSMRAHQDTGSRGLGGHYRPCFIRER